MATKRDKLRMIGLYLVISILFGAAVLLAYFILRSVWVDPPAYAPFVFTLSLAIGVYLRKRYVKKEESDRNSRWLIALFFASGLTVCGTAALNLYTDFTDVVKNIASVDALDDANGKFFHIHSVEPMPDQILDVVDQRYGDKNLRMMDFDYYAMIPLAVHDSGSETKVWIELHDHYQERPLTADQEKKFKDEAISKGRAWARQFDLKNVAYFERGGDNKAQEILEKNKVDDADIIVIMPGSGSFTHFRVTEVFMYFGLYLLASGLYAGIVWTLDGGKS